MKFARIIINLDDEAFEILKSANNFVNLRFSFFRKESRKSLFVFWVNNFTYECIYLCLCGRNKNRTYRLIGHNI